MSFPPRVWEPVGTSPEGKTLWASRRLEYQDLKDRERLMASMPNTQLLGDKSGRNR